MLKYSIIILLVPFTNILAQSAFMDRKQNALSLELGKSWASEFSPYLVHTGFSLNGFIDLGIGYSSGTILKTNNFIYDLSSKSIGFDITLIFIKPIVKVQPFGLALNLNYNDFKYERLKVNYLPDRKEFNANVSTPALIFYSLSEIDNNRIVIAFALGYSVTSGEVDGRYLRSNFVSLGLSADIVHEFTPGLLGTWGLGVGYAEESLSAGVSIGLIFKTKY